MTTVAAMAFCSGKCSTNGQCYGHPVSEPIQAEIVPSLTDLTTLAELQEAARWLASRYISVVEQTEQRLHAAEATLRKIEAEATGGCDHVRAIVSTYFDSEAER